MVSVILNPVLRAGECPMCNNVAKHRMGCEYGNLETALNAARKFINVHAADPNITSEMCSAYAAYVAALTPLPQNKPAIQAYL